MNASVPSKTRSKLVDERDGATELWVYRDGYHYPHVTFSKPKCSAVRYVLPADPGEIERLTAALAACQTYDYRQIIEASDRLRAALERIRILRASAFDKGPAIDAEIAAALTHETGAKS